MGANTKNYHKQGGDVWVVGGKLVPATETQTAHIADVTAAAGGDAPTEAEFNAAVTAINAILAALEGVGITAAS